MYIYIYICVCVCVTMGWGQHQKQKGWKQGPNFTTFVEMQCFLYIIFYTLYSFICCLNLCSQDPPKKLHNDSVSAYLNGSTKSCTQVQIPSQTNSFHGKAWGKSLLSNRQCKNIVSNLLMHMECKGIILRNQYDTVDANISYSL